MQKICVLLTIAGAVVLLAGIIKYHILLIDMKTHTQSKKLFGNRLYSVCFFLMILTLAGYAINIVMNIKYCGSTKEDFIISMIFFIGAVFAFLLVYVSHKIFLAASEN